MYKHFQVKAETVIQLGPKLTRGLGAEVNLEVGRGKPQKKVKKHGEALQSAEAAHDKTNQDSGQPSCHGA